MQCDRRALSQEQDGFLLDAPGLWALFDRQGIRTALRSGKAELQQWTVRAVRVLWQADHCPEFHKSLIEGTCLAGCRHGLQQGVLNQAFCAFLKYIEGTGENAGDDSENVAIDGGLSLPAGNRADCPGRVSSNARQSKQFREVVRQVPLVFFADDAGCLLQITGPVVIAQAFPKLQQTGFFHACQGVDIRQGTEKAFKKRFYGLYTCLLEHDFRNPYTVGGGFFPPGKYPGLLTIPAQQWDVYFWQYSGVL